MNRTIKPKLKETIPFFLLDHEVQIGEEEGVAAFISDPTGTIARLIAMLDGTRTVDQVIAEIHVADPHVQEQEVIDALEAMNAEGYLEDAAIKAQKLSDYERARYKTNLNYFSLFTDLTESKYEIQEKIIDTPISLLGVGGLGSQILYHLAALGFHNIKVLDFDTLDLSNFNRQLLYSEADVGGYKVELAKKRIAQFNPNVNLQITNKKIEAPQDVIDHIQGTDYVICVVDRPTLDIQNWVNEAVVKVGIPMVSGGVLNTRGLFYSMIPGVSGCVQCHEDHILAGGDRQQVLQQYMRSIDFQRKNAAISPNVGILAGILVNEFVKGITGIQEPNSLGRVMEFNFLSYEVSEVSAWQRNEFCSVCGQPTVQR